MDKFEILKRAQQKYEDLYNLINSGEYNPTTNDFYELDRARSDFESAYADVYVYVYEDAIDKGDF